MAEQEAPRRESVLGACAPLSGSPPPECDAAPPAASAGPSTPTAGPLGRVRRATKAARHLSVDMSRVGSNGSFGGGLGPRLSMQVGASNEGPALGRIRQSLGQLSLQASPGGAGRARVGSSEQADDARRGSALPEAAAEAPADGASTGASPGSTATGSDSGQPSHSALHYYFERDGVPTPTSGDFDLPVYSEIRPYLLVGSEELFAMDNWLEIMTQELKITHVLNMAEEANYPQVASRKEFRYMKYGTADHAEQNMDEAVEIALRFIDDARRTPNCRIFVHCKAGKSRSVTIVLAHLMLTEHLDLKQAYDDVRSRRSGIEPNLNFIQKLREIELSVMGYNSNLASLYGSSG